MLVGKNPHGRAYCADNYRKSIDILCFTPFPSSGYRSLNLRAAADGVPLNCLAHPPGCLGDTTIFLASYGAQFPI